jgi:hypothetical protein
VISFASGSAEVPTSMTDFLHKAAENLKRLPKGHVLEIAGDTDNSGDQALVIEAGGSVLTVTKTTQTATGWRSRRRLVRKANPSPRLAEIARFGQLGDRRRRLLGPIASNKWFVHLEGSFLGPIPTFELQRLVRSGTYPSTTLVTPDPNVPPKPASELGQLLDGPVDPFAHPDGPRRS